MQYSRQEENFAANDQTLVTNILKVVFINNMMWALEGFLRNYGLSIGDRSLLLVFESMMEKELPEPTYGENRHSTLSFYQYTWNSLPDLTRHDSSNIGVDVSKRYQNPIAELHHSVTINAGSLVGHEVV